MLRVSGVALLSLGKRSFFISLSPYRVSHSSPLNQNSQDVTETDTLNDVPTER